MLNCSNGKVASWGVGGGGGVFNYLRNITFSDKMQFFKEWSVSSFRFSIGEAQFFKVYKFMITLWIQILAI